MFHSGYIRTVKGLLVLLVWSEIQFWHVGSKLVRTCPLGGTPPTLYLGGEARRTLQSIAGRRMGTLRSQLWLMMLLFYRSMAFAVVREFRREQPPLGPNALHGFILILEESCDDQN
jgi:hypothetical protein